MFRLSASKADKNTNDRAQTLPTSTVQLPQLSETSGAEASTEATFEDCLKAVGGGATVGSDPYRSVAHEDEATSSLIQNLDEYVEQLSTARGKLEEDVGRIGKPCERVECETSEVAGLRSQREERVLRIRIVVNSGETEPEDDKLDEPQPSDL